MAPGPHRQLWPQDPSACESRSEFHTWNQLQGLLSAPSSHDSYSSAREEEQMCAWQAVCPGPLPQGRHAFFFGNEEADSFVPHSANTKTASGLSRSLRSSWKNGACFVLNQLWRHGLEVGDKSCIDHVISCSLGRCKFQLPRYEDEMHTLHPTTIITSTTCQLSPTAVSPSERVSAPYLIFKISPASEQHHLLENKPAVLRLKVAFQEQGDAHATEGPPICITDPALPTIRALHFPNTEMSL